MKALAIALLTGTALLAAAPVLAADLIVETPTAEVTSGFDWAGAYVGGFVGDRLDMGVAIAGGELGYNFLPSENLLLGIEGSGLLYLDGSGDHELFVHGKVGMVQDRIAIYALGGVGEYNESIALWDVGVGAEFALTDNITLDGQVFERGPIGSVPAATFVQAGLRYHF